uniref:Ig-like domain-containing protein n=1 Tax=Leptobrachium leishanense TaxID=445787 RepID=A0A8C5W6U5_9ANUR
MTTSLRFCLLTIFLTGSHAQHSVNQDPSVIASPGDNVRMSCTLGGGLTVSSNSVRFVQQKLNSTPRFILYYVSESSKGMGSGVPARFVGSGSGSVGYLSVNGVRPEDEGDYYCFTWTGTQHHCDYSKRGSNSKTYTGLFKEN